MNSLKEVLIRAARTFLQAAVGFIAANVVVYLSGMDGSSRAVKSAVAALITAAIASGLAAVMNMPALRSGKKPDGEVTEAEAGEEAQVGETTLGETADEIPTAADRGDEKPTAKVGDEPTEETEEKNE